MRFIIILKILLFTAMGFAQSNAVTVTDRVKVRINTASSSRIPKYIVGLDSNNTMIGLMPDSLVDGHEADPVWNSEKSGYAMVNEIPTNVSQLVNDVPYLSSVTWSQVSGKPVLFSGSYTDLTNKPNIPAQNIYSAGAGLGKSGTEPTASFYVDSSRFMSIYSATQEINTMQGSINGRVPQSRTLTINGVSQDLTANRTWSLTKSDVGLGNVDNTSDANKPVSTATQTALNGKFTTPSGSTSQYLRGDGSLATFPTIPAQFNPIAGTNISISGSYPNITFNAAATSVALRNKAGSLSTSPVFFTDTFSVATATPTIDLSSYITAAGKTQCKVISAVGYRVGATTGTSPNVTITGMTSTGVSLIFNQTNTATVTILGINVLSGLPTILVPDPTNIKVVIGAYFY